MNHKQLVFTFAKFGLDARHGRRVLCLSFLILFGAGVGSAFPLSWVRSDVSRVFPEYPGCERLIQPMLRDGTMWELTAIYERPGHKNKDGNYVGCGSITLRREKDAKQAAEKWLRFAMPIQRLTVRDYPAVRLFALCGNDDALPSTTIYFDNDKVLSVNAYRGSEPILTFFETVDFGRLRKAMNAVRK